MADLAARYAPSNDQIADLRANVYLAYATVALRRSNPRPPSHVIAGWLEQAERSARTAIALVRERPRNHQTLGNVLLARARLGDSNAFPEALEVYRRCWELAPFDAFALDRFADEALTLGGAREALGPARRAVVLYPEESMTQQVMGGVWLALGDTTAAVQAYRRALSGRWHGTPKDHEGAVRALTSILARIGRPIAETERAP